MKKKISLIGSVNYNLVKTRKKQVLHFFYKNRYKKRIVFFLFIKLTLNNLFAYVYNFYKKINLKKKINVKMLRYYRNIKFMSVSLGMTKYKGPAKLSNISLETSGFLLSKKLKKKKILRVNLVLFTRLNRKIKEFLKGFCKYGKIKIKRIFLFTKLAHNGCRIKAKKRL